MLRCAQEYPGHFQKRIIASTVLPFYGQAHLLIHRIQQSLLHFIIGTHTLDKDIPMIGDASLVGSGDTVGDCNKSGVEVRVSGDTIGTGVND